MAHVIRIGTRGSLLATTQAATVRDALIAGGHSAELVTISTEGDRSMAPIASLGVGVFTTALREAMEAGLVDAAVHSYKDLPTAADPRFTVAAIPPRNDPRDAVVARDGLTLGNCRSDRWWAHPRRGGPHSLEHWVSVWKSAPYEAT